MPHQVEYGKRRGNYYYERRKKRTARREGKSTRHHATHCTCAYVCNYFRCWNRNVFLPTPSTYVVQIAWRYVRYLLPSNVQKRIALLDDNHAILHAVFILCVYFSFLPNNPSSFFFPAEILSLERKRKTDSPINFLLYFYNLPLPLYA